MNSGKKIDFGISNVFFDTNEHLPKFYRNYKKNLTVKKLIARAAKFAEFIEKNSQQIIKILTKYETYEVAKDEIARSLDLLKNLKENSNYFKKEVGSVAAFLPRNQPLYALCCFGLVPSLMAKEAHVKSPTTTNHFFFDLAKALKVKKFFPNVFVCKTTREQFIKERSEIKFDKNAGQYLPVTDAVIFTGTMENADKVRKMFDSDVLFIANGAGHNPMVIAEGANIEKATESVMRIQLYNQGQDCANANSILVHKSVYLNFLKIIRKKLAAVKVGPYSNFENTVGPLSERKDLKRVQEILVDNSEWLDPESKGLIESQRALVYPAIICRPLKLGGNFDETFAPIFFIQSYEKDADLSLYFEDARYANNAMYVSIFGKSKYVDSLINKFSQDGKILHRKETIIRNTDLHAPGIERGVNPYGGYGRGASCLSIYGVTYSKPTLPQRDIYQYLVEYNKKNSSKIKASEQSVYQKRFLKQKEVFVPKEKEKEEELRSEYLLDASSVNFTQPFPKISSKQLFTFNKQPNIEYANSMSIEEVVEVKNFLKILEERFENWESLETKIYEIAKNKDFTDKRNKENQRRFFCNMYNLLIGRNAGPRIAKLTFFSDKSFIQKLLKDALKI